MTQENPCLRNSKLLSLNLILTWGFVKVYPLLLLFLLGQRVPPAENLSTKQAKE
jgi:hypothetical protein